MLSCCTVTLALMLSCFAGWLLQQFGSVRVEVFVPRRTIGAEYQTY